MTEFQALPLPATLQFDDLADLADSLGASFCSSPAYQYVFKDTAQESKRQAALAWLLQRNVWLHLAENSCFALRKRDLPTSLSPRCSELATDKVVCYFMLVNRTHRKPLSLWEMVSNGFLKIPFYYGVAATRRLLHVMAHGDRTSAEVWPDTTNPDASALTTYYLHNMIVHPSMQGCKVGSTCLQQALHCIRDRHGTAHPARVTLTTQEARNVTFYQRLGFRVVAESDCMDRESPTDVAFHSWYMQLDFHQECS
jgi:GNAT superfamily N-acetyltransferase